MFAGQGEGRGLWMGQLEGSNSDHLVFVCQFVELAIRQIPQPVADCFQHLSPIFTYMKVRDINSVSFLRWDSFCHIVHPVLEVAIVLNRLQSKMVQQPNEKRVICYLNIGVITIRLILSAADNGF